MPRSNRTDGTLSVDPVPFVCSWQAITHLHIMKQALGMPGPTCIVHAPVRPLQAVSTFHRLEMVSAREAHRERAACEGPDAVLGLLDAQCCGYLHPLCCPAHTPQTLARFWKRALLQ